MKLSVEISMYPLKDEYIPAIRDFIERLDRHPALQVITNTMSTRVFGDYDLLMDTLKAEMRASYERFGRAIFVCKFIEGDLSPDSAND
ncbi:YkoF family thiamine/hydroxymethylpyrimidine-binding protein [Microbulbifer halophilus]|uniref:YkoF family thiamine/hydroxymethylpyrimidine-binding protein n=1 Tax=Microbulbifer halophilus TaxID=453963 RepID=A0ABW5EH38_9GAMM|nr:YkoF family thiamine/hydroxymethylpyrimidine-binding protein [Microbulbifer halophilus]MCW8126932.1 YkoF family thiamine/hydroxymethylpyrimidine-binding protein [Microbulbifer halophilus]